MHWSAWIGPSLFVLVGIVLITCSLNGSLDIITNGKGLVVFNTCYEWKNIRDARVFRATLEGWDKSRFIDIALTEPVKKTTFAKLN